MGFALSLPPRPLSVSVPSSSMFWCSKAALAQRPDPGLQRLEVPGSSRSPGVAQAKDWWVWEWESPAPTLQVGHLLRHSFHCTAPMGRGRHCLKSHLARLLHLPPLVSLPGGTFKRNLLHSDKSESASRIRTKATSPAVHMDLAQSGSSVCFSYYHFISWQLRDCKQIIILGICGEDSKSPPPPETKILGAQVPGIKWYSVCIEPQLIFPHAL